MAYSELSSGSQIVTFWNQLNLPAAACFPFDDPSFPAAAYPSIQPWIVIAAPPPFET